MESWINKSEVQRALFSSLQKINVMQKLLVCNTQPWKEDEKMHRRIDFLGRFLQTFFFNAYT